jgi:hypothetical protein
MPQEKFCGIFFKEKTMDIMDDLISRKSLIDNLNKFAPEHYNALINMLIEKEPVAQKCGDCTRRQFYQVGYKDGKRDAQKWIPCSDELPNKDEVTDVFVTYLDCRTKEKFVDVECCFRGVWVKSLPWYESRIAWMIMPEPYKQTN